MRKDTEINWRWYNEEASDEERLLWQKAATFQEYFSDMLFEEGTCTHKFICCQAKDSENGEWRDDEIIIPDDFRYFDSFWVRYKVEPLSGINGYYNHKDQILCIDTKALEDNSVILHEMIHLFENIINEYPLYYHDSVFWGLYSELKTKIPKLDELMTDHAHVLNESQLYEQGGLHDILFLLKSFDLDIKMGYSLGTVFGYGRIKEFENYEYHA